MRVKTIVLCSSSLAMLGFASAPALAQTAPTDAAPQAQSNPAQPAEQTAAQTDESAQAGGAGGEDIVVTGLRQSLRSSQNIKRNSSQIVDSIVAEDIGKLPDVAVSDTAARIPGIQVVRERGEAGSVLLRGLNEDFFTTTYNGREIFTAERRSVALQDFPAGAIGAIEAFKTSTADLVEPGLSGLINVRSHRPFDFKGMQVAGSVWGVYPQQSRDFAPNAQLLLSDRWDTGIGEVGALINFSYTRLHYQDSIRRHGFFIADLAGGRSPDWPEIHYNQADRWRPSINGALQWRPMPGLEFYVEGLWQGYREKVTDNMWAQPLWNGGSATYSNIVKDGNNIVSGTVTRPANPGETWGFQGATRRDTNTYQFAAGGSYDAGSLRITGDVARTRSKFVLHTESIDYQINTNNYTVDWYTGRPGGYGPTFQVSGIDPANPAIYTYRGFFEDYLTAKGKDWQARLDFEWEPGLDFLPKVQWGVRFTDRDAADTAGSFYWDQRARNIPISAVPLDYELVHSAFHGDNHPPFPISWLAPTYSSVHENLDKLRQFNINLCNCGSINGPPVDPTRSFSINEKAYAAYAQLNYELPLGGDVRVDGSLGLRAVKTKEDINGTVSGLSAAPSPVGYHNEYTDWLPNLNMRIHFTPDVQLRLAATQTRTRPTFQQLNPSFRLDPPPGCNPAVGGCVRTGGGGNPFLKPLTSNNYDASLEYYFSRTGFVSAAAFRRDMKGFIANRQFQLPDPDPTGLPILITGTINTNKGRIQGFEGQFSTFFDFASLPDWLRRFGVQANVTYIKAEADFPTTGTDPTTKLPYTSRLRIPDVSKWTYNLVGMYEGGGLTLRLAYNYRSDFPEGALSDRGGYTLQGHGHSVSRLDWSSSYDIARQVTLFFDWTNILGKPYRSDIVRVNYNAGGPSSVEKFPMLVRFEESVLSGGIRFRF